jgi:hypothetical protein
MFFLGFDAIVLVGCWSFVGNQKEEGCTCPATINALGSVTVPSA